VGRAPRASEHVVGALVAILADGAVLAVLDAVESSMVPSSAQLGRGVLQPEAAPALDLERLFDRHRQVDELQLGGEEPGREAVRPSSCAAGAIFTLEGRRIVRADCFFDPTNALQAVGLRE
jgi:hypothetical protein